MNPITHTNNCCRIESEIEFLCSSLKVLADLCLSANYLVLFCELPQLIPLEGQAGYLAPLCLAVSAQRSLLQYVRT